MAEKRVYEKPDIESEAIKVGVFGDYGKKIIPGDLPIKKVINIDAGETAVKELEIFKQ